AFFPALRPNARRSQRSPRGRSDVRAEAAHGIAAASGTQPNAGTHWGIEKSRTYRRGSDEKRIGRLAQIREAVTSRRVERGRCRRPRRLACRLQRGRPAQRRRSEEHTSELQSRENLV